MTKKVLLADDNKEYRSSMKRVLEGYGCDVYEVKNADEEIAAAKKETYDLIVTDKDMEDQYGRKGGIHAIKEIRKFNDKTPILFSSADLTEEDKKELDGYKKVDTISKVDMFKKLKEVLKK